MTKRKIALFGGTFDPIHLGHTTVAAYAIEKIGAEKLIFIPAMRSPLKGFMPKASYDDRYAMIALAIAGNKRFELSDYECNRPQPCYTLETIKHFKAEYGSKAIIYWLLGADSIDDLPLWYRIVELIDQCNLITMHRASFAQPDFSKFNDLWGSDRVEKLQRNVIQTPLIDISSTEVRSRLAAGLNVSDMLNPDVANYIFKHNLYQSGGTG